MKCYGCGYKLKATLSSCPLCNTKIDRKWWMPYSGYSTLKRQSNPRQILITRPMTWESAGAWLDGEGTSDFYYDPKGFLHVHITIWQKNKQVSGYKVLEDIKTFIEKEIGIRGAIYPKTKIGLLRLTYTRLAEVHKLAVAILPYLRHPAKIDKIIRLIKEIENYAKTRKRKNYSHISKKQDKNTPTYKHSSPSKHQS